MPNDKKDKPLREKKTPPTRDRQLASPAARRKKSDSDNERSASPLREKKSTAAPRKPRTEGADGRSASPSRERRPASFSPRTKKSEGDREKSSESRSKRTGDSARSTAPVRERKPAAQAGEGEREKKSPSRAPRAGATDRSAAPPRERKTGTDSGKRSAGPRANKTDAPGDKNLVFPREARRYINVYLGLGSNVGNRRAQIQAAINLISEHIGKIAKKSHLYETEPWGNTNQDGFLNQVVMINTMLDPRDLLKEIGFIEQELGRVRPDKEKWGPRTIDIDILFYGKRVVRDKGLEIPHPEMQQRAFVLVPLMEIAPDLEHPLLKLPIDELYMVCEDQSEVVMLDS